jgi:hypothetical protein
MNDLAIAKKLCALHSSANSRDIEFNLSFKKLKQLMTRKTCFYTGVRFDKKDNPMSIDRVDNTRGYVDDNVVACTVAVNQIKANLTIAQIEMLHKKVIEYKRKYS